MSILDFWDELDARKAKKYADQHGANDDSMLAYRDREDAKHMREIAEHHKPKPQTWEEWVKTNSD